MEKVQKVLDKYDQFHCYWDPRIIIHRPWKRFSEWGMSRPPSAAPFIAAKIRAPVDVRARPTSKKSSERSGLTFFLLNSKVFTINFGLTFIDLVQVEFGEQTPCKQKPSAVGCSIVGETNFDSIARKFMCIS